ncbi:MAG TPA: class I SAM-dependent methyltransferase [Phototrophicaceae bacterium]|nr:class I SAM-dependent methyltransferase [Phototrophicaceae bacterium]
MSELDQEQMWAINRAGWDAVAPTFYGAAALPTYGPLAPTEDDLHLLGDVQGKTVVEIGCGSGHSLLYLAQHGATDLWGIDLSTKQIEFARALLAEHNVSAQFFNAPMEQNPGIPTGHFDLALSLYALGWTTDLASTLTLIYSYLKPGGAYVFSWEHPVYTCLGYADGHVIVKGRYYEQTILKPSWENVPIVMHQRKMSTFINAAVGVGFQIERLEEGEVNRALASEADYAPERWYSVPRAERIPTTFILKLRKPLLR